MLDNGQLNMRAQRNVLTVCSVLVLHIQLAKTEIAQSDVPGIIEKNVLRLQITIDDIETMQTLQGAQKFCSVESSTINVETLFLLQVMEEFTAVHKGENEVKLLW